MQLLQLKGIMSLSIAIDQSVRGFFSGTLISRLTGVVRDISMAAFFGADPSVAALFIALRLTSFVRRLLGEGGMQTAFVPQFEQIKAKSKEEAAYFFRDLMLFLALLLGPLVILTTLIFSYFSTSEVMHLTGVLFPGILFLTLYALNSSFLLCCYSTLSASLAPMMLNIIWIIAIFSFREEPVEVAIVKIAWMLVFGYLCQWLFTLPKTVTSYRNLTSHFVKNIQLFSRQNRRLFSSLILSLIGVGATQVNSLVDVFFARIADPSGPVYLFYALRIEQLPFALFGLASVNAVFPSLSAAVHAKRWGELNEVLQKCMQRLFALLIPCTIALLVLGEDVIQLLFCHVNFTLADGFVTTKALFAYGLSLIPAIFVLLLSSLFYAQKNYRLPALISLAMVGVNVLLNSLCVFGFGFGAVSVAIATAISSWINASLLIVFLFKNMPEIEKVLPREGGKVLFSSVLAGIFTLSFSIPLGLLFSFMIKCLLFTLVLLTSLRLLQAKESERMIFNLFIPARYRADM